MDRAEYLNAVNKYMYQGEVLGEALLACYVGLKEDAARRYKWGTILQLETAVRDDSLQKFPNLFCSGNFVCNRH